MPHHSLDDPRGDPGGIGQRGTLATQRMEVEHEPRIVTVRDLGGFQVDPHHLGPAIGQGEDRGL